MSQLNESASDVLAEAHQELQGEPLNPHKLLAELMHDCGVDALGLTALDFVNAWGENPNTRWFDVHYACAAALASYYAQGECSNIELIRAMAAMVILSNTSRRGNLELDMAFDYMIGIMYKNRGKCNAMLRLRILRIVLCGGEQQGRAD